MIKQRRILTHDKFYLLEKIMKEYDEISKSELIDELNQHNVRNPEYIINAAREEGYIFLNKNNNFEIN